MKMLSRGTVLMLALALLIMGLASPLPAGDQTIRQSSEGAVTVPKPTPLKETASALAATSSLRTIGAVLRPRSSSATFDYGGGGSIFATANPNVVLNTPVYLPQGAVVSGLRMYFNDTSALDSVGWFSIYNSANQSLAGEWSVTSTGSSGLGYADSGPINHTVDNTLYGYVLNWLPFVADSTMQLVGFQLFYTAPPGRTAVIPLN